MLVKLPESARQRKRSIGGTAVSALLHMSLIGGAVVGTQEMADSPGVTPPEMVDLIYKIEEVKPEERAPKPDKQPLIPTTVQLLDRIVPPIDILKVPEGLPPTDKFIGTISVGAFEREPIAPTSSAIGTGQDDHVFDSNTVEHAVTLIPGETPEYPRMLAAAGVEGMVQVQFVVDTAGRVERTSIKVLRSDHAQFERAVRNALERMRFVPARAGDRRVRQLVEQPFSFALRR